MKKLLTVDLTRAIIPKFADETLVEADEAA